MALRDAWGDRKQGVEYVKEEKLRDGQVEGGERVNSEL
jgi:hypothetical protein